MPVKRMYCGECESFVRADSPSSSHVLHLLLSLISCGIWIPIWMLASSASDFRCSQCGSRARPAKNMAMHYLKILGICGAVALFLAIVVGLRTTK